MIDEEMKIGYDDITIVPERLTDISSRKECNPYDVDGYLPIFASCMSSVVSIENAKKFNDAKIKTIIPRSYSIADRLNYLAMNNTTPNFVAFSLEEARTYFIDTWEATNKVIREDYKLSEAWPNPIKPFRICIDLANGHMKKLLDTVKEIKKIWGNGIIIMTGNIANPRTYIDYENAGVDYCRITVGSGSVCSTASNTGVFYPPFSLLKEVYTIKKSMGGKCKIVVDGGIRGFRDIQKALIYADYVMIGGLFNKAMESAGKTTYGSFYWNVRGKKIYRPLKTLLYYGKEIPKRKYDKMFKLVKANKLTVWKEIYGMSSKIAQALISSANTGTVTNLKTSEGLHKYQKVEYNIQGWAENETDFLRSAMSYTNSTTLDDYKESQWVRISKRMYND